jgi:predicted dehydrogenase
LDLALFLFGPVDGRFELWSAQRFENRALDHVIFGSAVSRPAFVFEGTLMSWRNTFMLDILGERGSLHVHGLCKWGPSHFILRRRALPSGKPHEEVQTLETADPTWALEYRHFMQLCERGDTNLENDQWIQGVLSGLAQALTETVSP